jgi:hypothetical protein
MNKNNLTKEIIKIMIERQESTLGIVGFGDGKSNHYIFNNGDVFTDDGKLIDKTSPMKGYEDV